MAAISFTVDVEEWYHDLWPGAEKIVMEYYNYKLPKGTFVKPLQPILQMLERQRVRSTFFILGECAEACPEAIKEIYDKGHEIASHGYVHRDFTKMSPDELAKIEIRNRQLLKRITGEKPQGFRAPLFKINSKVLATMEKVGYEYDSSVVPSISIPRWFGYFGAPLNPYRIGRKRNFFEVPVAVFPYLRLPAGGGWFIRNFGLRYVETAIRLLLRKKLPAIIYIHPLDVYSGVPKLVGIPFHITRRCGEYTLKALEHILKKFNCERVTIKDLLRMWKEQT
jgi:polysaccharide deacetylase family protein (PEP-CTERM system associated)